ncbi:MAG: DUF5615 family PIN-like protein [Chloroflexi bacterium]|nr:DUF5615 family PIN-like protein [Chloroflexota bacterium]
MDENVHGAITKGLRQYDIDVLRVQEDGYAGRNDSDVLDRATELSRVLFSQDDDLLREATLRQRGWRPFSGVIYAHQVHNSIGQCIADLTYLAHVGEVEDFTGQVYYLPL